MTAYEIRISDCVQTCALPISLSIVSTQVEGDDMLRLAAQKHGIATDGVPKARLLDLVEERLAEEARCGQRKIGRASCWARVCKYVSRSVVAVRIKHKDQV